jgi:excisionase family DNA binding protein
MATRTGTEIGFLPKLLTLQEAADFLHVSPRTISNWISDDRIPYVRLPGGEARAQYRIPLGALISSLTGTYDLGAAVREAVEHAQASGLSSDEIASIFFARSSG